MSGIVAAHGPFDPAMGERMLHRLSSRGPDGVSRRELAGSWIGSRYLSISDPTAGQQPVAGTTNDLWLVGDGEVYNHRPIRDRLGADRFRTRSDLEVVIQLFEEDGIDAFAQLWGTFALVVSGGDGQFVAARDALGVAPLYWARREETVVFASEMKAFDADWRGSIEPFPPGRVWSPQAGLSQPHESPVGAPVLLKSRSAAEEPPTWVFDALRDTLVRAVEDQMRANVPIGVLLSGGVDSSIITAIAARKAAEGGSRLKTFTVGLASSPDLVAARLVAEAAGTDHFEHVYTAEDAIALVPDVIAILESFDPTLVHSAVPNLLVAKLARAEVEVVLAGEGADELFAGYEHYGLHDDGDDLQEDLLSTLEGMHIGGLQRVDRVCAAHGLEPRLPFLDLDMVELALALPPAWKLISAERPAKWLLRRAFDGWVPDEVLWRRKEQFGEGTGMNDVLSEHFGGDISKESFDQERNALNPPLRTREELAYYRIFCRSLAGVNAQATVGRFAQA